MSSRTADRGYSLKDPPDVFDFIREDGISIPLDTYVQLTESGDPKYFLMCDLCGLMVSKGHGGRLRAHRRTPVCNQRLAGNLRRQAEAEERERAAGVLETLQDFLQRPNEDVQLQPSAPVVPSQTVAPMPVTPQIPVLNLPPEQAGALTSITPIRDSALRSPSAFDVRERHQSEKLSVNTGYDFEIPALFGPSIRPPSPMRHLSLDSVSESVETDPDFPSIEFDDEFDEPLSPKSEDEGTPCPGQRIKWEIEGSVLDTYAYSAHAQNLLPWTLFKIANGFIYIRHRTRCARYLDLETLDQGICSECSKLRTLPEFLEFVKRARTAPKPNTPWAYLNARQLRDLLVSARKRIYEAENKIRKYEKRLAVLENTLSNYQRMTVMLGQQRIGGVARILASSLRNGDSAAAICNRLQSIISALPSPGPKIGNSSWSQLDYDIAFLIKAMGGPRLLYALQKAERYPSPSSLRNHNHIPEIIIPSTTPTAADFSEALANVLGEKGRLPPKNLAVGQAAMADGCSLEEILRMDLKRNVVVGLCREHSADIKTTIDSVEDITAIAEALENGKCHRGKDGTVLAIAPVTDPEDYRPSPLLVSPSCKAETGDQAADWVQHFLDTYHSDPNGEARHGPICTFATDGEATFRRLRFNIGLSESLDPATPMGETLYSLPGMNTRTGKRGLITTADPKHIIKRFATLLRSPTGIQIGDTAVSKHDIFQVLTVVGKVPPKTANDLLDPADKQNVPKAVTLLELLHEITLGGVSKELDPALGQRLPKITFLITVLTHFLYPFIRVDMTLSEQIRSLSVYSHLITAMYRKHKNAFMTSALFADSQAVVKSVIFTVARLQQIDGNLLYHLIMEGQDRLEGTFSHTRTQDHARNFDSLQFAQKLAIGAEINAILLRHPHLDRGHFRRNLTNMRGVDHVNPKSWRGDVRVGNVEIPDEYLGGRDIANKILEAHFGEDGPVDFNALFQRKNVDHLRPFGVYVGLQASAQVPKTSDLQPVDADEPPELPEPADDDESDVLQGGLSSVSNFVPSEAGEVDGDDLRDVSDETGDNGTEYDALAHDNTSDPDGPQSDALNPAPPHETAPHYLEVNGKNRHKARLVSEILNSLHGARKVLTRPQRAAGVTIESSLRKSRLLNYEDGTTPDDQKLKVNDLGGILVRVNRRVCLAVCEVLHFKKKGAPSSALSSIKRSELRASGDNAVTVSVQILNMCPNRDHGRDYESWEWQGTYTQSALALPSGRSASDASTAVLQQKHFVLAVPGTLFYSLAADVIYNADHIAVWLISNDLLQETLDLAWGALNPDQDDIISNIESVPTINTSALPYIGLDMNEKLSFNDPTLPPSSQLAPAPGLDTKMSSKTPLECRLCGKKVTLGLMRDHVGRHILRYQFGTRDKLHQDHSLGSNPCGWCGLEGCRTYLQRQAAKIAITSNCPYHFKGMQYVSAVKVSTATPSTNVPVHCTICPPGDTRQPVTFWKYNFVHHLVLHHINADGSCPPITYEMLQTVHISFEEAEAIGIPREEVKKWREDHNFPGSDDLREADAQQTRNLRDLAMAMNRKRGLSNISSAERDPSPTKISRL